METETLPARPSNPAREKEIRRRMYLGGLNRAAAEMATDDQTAEDRRCAGEQAARAVEQSNQPKAPAKHRFALPPVSLTAEAVAELTELRDDIAGYLSPVSGANAQLVELTGDRETLETEIAMLESKAD